MLPERTNGLSDEELEKIRIEYDNATPDERRAMEIRDLGYPMTQINKTEKRNLEELCCSLLMMKKVFF